MAPLLDYIPLFKRMVTSHAAPSNPLLRDPPLVRRDYYYTNPAIPIFASVAGFVFLCCIVGLLYCFCTRPKLYKGPIIPYEATSGQAVQMQDWQRAPAQVPPPVPPRGSWDAGWRRSQGGGGGPGGGPYLGPGVMQQPLPTYR